MQKKPNSIAEQAEPQQRLQPPKGTDQQQQLRPTDRTAQNHVPELNDTLIPG